MKNYRMGIIALEGMKIFAHHGAYESEKISGNHFLVDVYVHAPVTPAGQSDQLIHAVDYARIAHEVNHVFQERVNLLETLVLKTGKRLLEIYPSASKVKVRVSKLNPQVEIETWRSMIEEEFTR